MTEERRAHLQSGMRGLSQRLAASLVETASLDDSLTKGEMREEALVAVLRPFIPQRYDIVKGVIVNAAGQQSLPQDVILLDTHVAPTLMGAGGNKTVPVEGVVGVIQLKSRATKQQVRDAIKNIASAKVLLSDEIRYGMPLASVHTPGLQSTNASFFGGALFLSSSVKDPQPLVDCFCEEVVTVEPRERVDALCIVDELTVLWGNPSEGGGVRMASRGEQAETPLVLQGVDETPLEDSLMFFYYCLLEHLHHWITPVIRWLDYLAGPEWAGEHLRFSYGYHYDADDPPEWVREPPSET